jgi:hypothetical protein
MAAKALTSGPDATVLKDLKVVAPSAHWRNTWLLAVGTLYREKQRLFDQVLQGLRNVDAEDWLSFLTSIGPGLATDVLDDGVAATNPRHVRLLVDHALDALDALDGVNLGARRLGQVLADQTGFTTMTRTSIEQALERAIAASPESREAALLVLKELGAKGRIGPLAAKARQLTSAHSKPRPSEQPRTARPAVALADALPAWSQTGRHCSRWSRPSRRSIRRTGRRGPRSLRCCG